MSKTTGVIFIITRPDKTMLLQLRDGNSKMFPWTWCLPGGRSDKGEGELQTVIREVKEEYDIDSSINDLEYLIDFPNENNKVYFCHVKQESSPKLQEGADMKWVSLEELSTMELGFEQNLLVETIRKAI
jgi:8-oxo-dGTP pyrophosphatase MutT (NUDIX family)